MRRCGRAATCSPSLANGAGDLRDRWPKTEAEFDRALREARYEVERSLDRVDTAMRSAERSPDEGRIHSAQTEVRSAARRLPEARRAPPAACGTASSQRRHRLPWSPELLGLGAIVTAFAGVLTNPLQRAFGVHRRRLHRLIDTLGVELKGGRQAFQVRDHYAARIFDLVDLARTAYQVAT